MRLRLRRQQHLHPVTTRPVVEDEDELRRREGLREVGEARQDMSTRHVISPSRMVRPSRRLRNRSRISGSHRLRLRHRLLVSRIRRQNRHLLRMDRLGGQALVDLGRNRLLQQRSQ